MNYLISKPSLLLSPFVKQYWGMESCVPAGDEHIQRIVPSGLMELMFYLGDRPVSLNKNKLISDNTIVSGQQKDNYDLRVSGTMSLFSVIFRPQGAMMFFDLPLNEFYNQIIPLRYLLRDKVDELETRLFECNSFPGKIAIVENFLLSQLHKNYKKYEANRINKSIGLINQAKGIIDIDGMASTACLSRKQFERTFSACIGTSPKQFLRIVRFQHVVYMKQKKPFSRLSDLAYDCGFFDQAHMVNEFKALSGLTPGQFFSECEPVSDYFSW